MVGLGWVVFLVLKGLSAIILVFKIRSVEVKECWESTNHKIKKIYRSGALLSGI